MATTLAIPDTGLTPIGMKPKPRPKPAAVTPGLTAGVAAPLTGSVLTPPATATTGGATPATATPVTTGISPFSLGQNLIGTQIAPQTSARGGTLAGLADTAAQRVGTAAAPTYTGVAPAAQDATRGLLGQAQSAIQNNQGLAGMGATGSFGFAGDTGEARGATLQQLRDVLSGTPDRGELARQEYDLLVERSQPQFDSGLRSIGQRAAALGRTGAGMTTNELTDFGTLYNRGLDQSRRQLATESAGLTLQDQLDQLNASRGVTSDFSSQDLGAGNLNLGFQDSANNERARAFGRGQSISDQFQNLAGFERQLGLDTEGSNVRERDTAYGVGRDAFDQSRAQLGDLYGAERQVRGQDALDRDELRGERGFQYGLSQDATSDNIRERELEEMLLNGRFGRGLQSYNAGQEGLDTLPYLYNQQGDQFAEQANTGYGAAGDLLAEYARRRAAQGQPDPTRENVTVGRA